MSKYSMQDLFDSIKMMDDIDWEDPYDLHLFVNREQKCNEYSKLIDERIIDKNGDVQVFGDNDLRYLIRVGKYFIDGPYEDHYALVIVSQESNAHGGDVKILFGIMFDEFELSFSVGRISDDYLSIKFNEDYQYDVDQLVDTESSWAHDENVTDPELIVSVIEKLYTTSVYQWLTICESE